MAIETPPVAAAACAVSAGIPFMVGLVDRAVARLEWDFGGVSGNTDEMRRFLRRFALLVTVVGLVAVAPAATASAPSRGMTKPPVPGAQRFEGGWAVPVESKAPAWFDKSFADKVVAAGTDGVRAPAGVSLPAAAALD